MSIFYFINLYILSKINYILYIEGMGIQSTFKILGQCLLVIIVLCSFLLDKAPENKSSTSTNTVNYSDKTHKEMMKDSKFWVLWLIYTLVTTGGMMLICHAAGIVNEFSLGDAASIIMMTAVANTARRIVWGMISDKIGRFITVVLMFIVSGTVIMLLNFNQGLGSTAGVVGMLLIYLSFGGFLGAFPGIADENWGSTYASSNYGWMFTAYGIAAIVGPQIASATGYAMAFIVSTIMSGIGIILMLSFMAKNKSKA